MSFIKQEWWCQINETPGKPDENLQKEQEMGIWRKIWEFIKLLFIWVD